MLLPRDFLEEVEIELRTAHRLAAAGRERAAALWELRAVALPIALRPKRPITVFDVIRATEDPVERARRDRLVALMRAPDLESGRFLETDSPGPTYRP